MLATDFDNPGSGASRRRCRRKCNVSSQLYAHCTRAQPTAGCRPATAARNRCSIDPRLRGRAKFADLAPDRAPFLRADEAPDVGLRRSRVRRSQERLHGGRGGRVRGHADAIRTRTSAARASKTVTRSEREGEALGIPAANLDAWAAAHADYVQITGDYPGVRRPLLDRGHGAGMRGTDRSETKPTADERDACAQHVR